MKPSHIILASLLVIALLVGGVQAATYTAIIPILTDDYVKATSTYDSLGVRPHLATDPTNILTGSYEYGWLSLLPQTSNQRFNIDYGGLNITRYVEYQNHHNSGGLTTRGVQDFTLWGSNNASAFLNLNYGDDISWTQLTTSVSSMDEHNLADASDPKNFTVTNSVGYRYFSFKFANNYGDGDYIGVRRIVLYTEDGYSLSPVSSFTSTNRSVATNVTEGWEGVAPFTMQLTNTSTNPPHTSFVWNATNVTGNNVPFTFNETTFYNPIYTFRDAGNYTIELNVTNAYGTNISTQITYVNVSTPAPVASFTSDAYVGTDPLTATLTDTSTNTPTSWSYKIRNETAQTGYEISTDEDPTIVLGNGTYRVNLTATNDGGSDTSDDVWINVSSTGATKPIAISSLSRSVIPAGWYTWFNDTSQNTPMAWCWTFGDGTFAATANGSKTYYQRTIQNVSSCPSNAAGTNCSYNIIRVI